MNLEGKLPFLKDFERKYQIILNLIDEFGRDRIQCQSLKKQ